MHPPKANGISFIIDEEAKEISERISSEGGGEQNQSSLSPPSLGRGLLYLLLEEGAFVADFHLEFSRDSVERNRVTTRTPHGDRGRGRNVRYHRRRYCSVLVGIYFHGISRVTGATG